MGLPRVRALVEFVRRRSPAPAALFVLLFAGAGCDSAFDNHRAALDRMHADGRYDLAAKDLDDPAVHSLYAERNELLWMLDRGAVALALGDDDKAVVDLDDAERRMAERRKESFGESAGALLINDTYKPYLGEPYEEMYLNVFKMLAQLEAGRIGGGATVEARRMAIKANELRDEYLKVAPKARDAAGLNKMDAGPRADFDSGGNFIESPLGLFLSAVAFMHDDDASDQEVAARRLTEAITAQRGLIGPVRAEPFEGLGEMAPPSRGSGKGHVLIVAFSGRGPTKVSTRQEAMTHGGGAITLDLPELRWTPSEAADARVILDESGPRESPSRSAPGNEALGMDLVEDLSRVAYENHQRQMPIIYARTFARVAAKAAGVGVATWGASTAHNDAATAAVLIGGIALLLASEHADLRCWEFLPGQAHVRLVEVPSGRHDLRIEWLGHGGGTLAKSGRHTIDVPEGGLTTVVEYWWR